MRVRSDRGVSTIIGAILVLGIATSVLVTVRVSFAPEWQKEAQAGHMRAVMTGMLDALASAQRAANATGATTVMIPLSSNALGFAADADYGRLGFQPNTVSLNISTDSARILGEGGRSFSDTVDVWLPANGSANLTSVADVTNLRLRFPSGIGDNNDGDNVTLKIYNRTGALAGSMTFMVTTYPSGFTVTTTTRDASGSTLDSDMQSYFQHSPLPNYWIDVLRRDFRFTSVIAAAEAPFGLNLTVNNVVASGQNLDLTLEYSAAYDKLVGGTLVPIGGGVIRANYTSAHPTGTITYDGANPRFVDQTFALEGGGLVLTQPDGATLVSAPLFRATQAANFTTLRLNWPALQGPPSMLGGTSRAQLSILPSPSTRLLAIASNFTLTLTSTAPGAWSNAWSASLVDAGLAPGRDFALTTTSNAVKLQLFGTNASPIAEDVILDLTDVPSNVTLN